MLHPRGIKQHGDRQTIVSSIQHACSTSDDTYDEAWKIFPRSHPPPSSSKRDSIVPTKVGSWRASASPTQTALVRCLNHITFHPTFVRSRFPQPIKYPPFSNAQVMKISGCAFAAVASSLAIATRSATAFSSQAPASSSRLLVLPAGASSSFDFGSSTTALYSSIDDKTEVREYFNNEGFSRWNKIYSDSDEVNTVQLDIRKGHDMTIQKILNWIRDDGDIAGKTVCDCGCGVGSLAIPLAQMGEFSGRDRMLCRRGRDEKSFATYTFSRCIVASHRVATIIMAHPRDLSSVPFPIWSL
jgi:hypothetical protein